MTSSHVLIELMPVARRAVTDYLGVRAGEQVAVIGDTRTPPEVPLALASAVRELGAEPISACIAARRTSGEPPPSALLSLIESSDVVVSVASRSLYHTVAKERARESGTRGALNSPPTLACWLDGAMLADFRQLRDEVQELARVLTGGKEVHVTSPLGTDVRMSIDGRSAVGFLSGVALNPGEIAAWPAAEVSLPPVEGTTEGTIVLECAMTDIGELRSPVTWEVRGGEVVGIDGGVEAAKLLDHIDGVPNARNIAELGIGMNPHARLVPDITESKKRRGTAHMALGDNASDYGGTVSSDVHIDGLMQGVTVRVDETVVVDRGTVLV